MKCRPKTTDTRTYRIIAKTLKEEAGKLGLEETVKDIGVPGTGLPTEDYFDKIWEIVEVAEFESIIVILDEIDKHGDKNQVLYDLSRSVEDQYTDAFVTVVGITNRLDLSFSPRVKSSFKPEEFLFKPYSESQLRKILEHRIDAFRNGGGVLDDGVISRTAELAADEHGDARTAVDTLRKAGELAEDADLSPPRVTVEHVQQAKAYVELDRFREQIAHSSEHTHLLLYALARLTDSSPDQVQFPTSEIRSRYSLIAKDVGIEALGHSSIIDKLEELAMLGVIETEKRHGGRYGNKLVHELMQNTNLVKNAVLRENEDLREIMESQV